MTELPKNDAPIVDVPPELRGPSDEEILALNPVKDEKRFRDRPSKKEREARKVAKEQEKFRKIAAQYENRENLPSNPFSSASSRPMPKLSDFDRSKGLFKSTSGRASTSNAKSSLFVPGAFKKAASLPTEFPTVDSKPAVVLPSRPASGRVLSGSFGTSRSAAPKARIISGDELGKKTAMEEKKKFSLAKAAEEAARAATLAKMSATGAPVDPFASPKPFSQKPSIFKEDSPLADLPSTENSVSSLVPESPVKRKRGRPRKNPLPESL